MSSLKYDIHVTTVLHRALKYMLKAKEVIEAQVRMSTSFAIAASYFDRAEAFVELIEMHDCGCVGGFSRGQHESDGALKHSNEYNTIFARWYFLMKKYSATMEKIEKKEVDEAKEYFKTREV